MLQEFFTADELDPVAADLSALQSIPTDPVGAAAFGRDSESEIAASSVISGIRQKPPGGSRVAGSVLGAGYRPREEDYYGVCHTDVVKGIVITEGGKIYTAG